MPLGVGCSCDYVIITMLMVITGGRMELIPVRGLLINLVTDNKFDSLCNKVAYVLKETEKISDCTLLKQDHLYMDSYYGCYKKLCNNTLLF
jgi:hypothetical protein